MRQMDIDDDVCVCVCATSSIECKCFGFSMLVEEIVMFVGDVMGWCGVVHFIGLDYMFEINNDCFEYLI